MSGVMERTLAILERLATDVDGVSLAILADELHMPRSAAHRLLFELSQRGYVRQSRERGDYILTTHFISLGLNYLKASGVLDSCQPILDRLAEACGEFVQFAVVDVDHLSQVAKSQGARSGLLYNDMSVEVHLSSTSAGQAWLSTLADNDVLMLVAKQGLGSHGPQAPSTITGLLKELRSVRKLGYAITADSYSPGLSAVAAPVMRTGAAAVGVLTVSGPTVRLTRDTLESFVPYLLRATVEVAEVTAASPLFNRPYGSA